MTDQLLIEQLQRTAHFAAWRAGQVIREQHSTPTNIRDKSFRNLVTDTDHAAQAAVIEAIRTRHHDHTILAEEDTANHAPEGEEWQIPDGVVWMIDPVDGTSNFANGLPLFCVSVGAALDGVPVAGAIYDPLRQDFFLAARGLGASLNGRPLPALTGDTLANAIISLDWSHAPAQRNRSLLTVSALAGHCRTIRALGSAALALAYVAAGRVGVYFNFDLQPWDTAAGAILIREVGGILYGWERQPWRLGQEVVFSGHADLLDQVFDLLS